MDFASLQHSVFLQALGSAILNSLWQGFLLWFIYETISVYYKTASAKFKNNLGTVLLFFSFAWFFIEFVFKFINEKNAAPILAMAPSITGEPAVHAVWNLQGFLSYAEACLPYLSVAYIFLLIFLMTRLFSAYRYVYFISNQRLMEPAGDLQTFASTVARQIGLVKKISVWISHHVDVPATIGFIKPVILIPFASLNNLSGHQLEAIILHELSHIKRNDYFTNLIISVIEAILFFNPFTALLINTIKRERENCCDDFVLQYQYDPHAYASALLRLEQSRVNKLQLAIGAVSGKKQLLSRIKRITNATVVSRQFNYGQRLLALLLVTAIICSIAWLSPAEKRSVAVKMATKVVGPIPPTPPNIKPPVNIDETIEKQSKNLQAIILKYISPKGGPLPLTENAVKNKSTDDLLPVDSDEDFSPGINLKQPPFSFKGNNFKLSPQAVNAQNFPFQNMGFNFDLDNIDMNKLNDGLQKAFKEINTLDWSKIQNNINQSLSKIKTVNFPTKELEAFYIEKAKDFFKLRKDQQQYNTRIFTNRLTIPEQLLIEDSIRRSELPSVNENNARLEKVYNTKQMKYAEEAGPSYNFNYGSASNENANKKEITKCIEDNKSSFVVSVPFSKNLRVLVKHLPGFGDLSNRKKLLRLSLGEDAKNSQHQSSLINVEITELP
ncbi:MAG: M56 family metallopeptidase [Ginsengibacter sp.]